MASLTRLIRRVSSWDIRDRAQSQSQSQSQSQQPDKQSVNKGKQPAILRLSSAHNTRPRRGRNARIDSFTSDSAPLEHDLFCQADTPWHDPYQSSPAHDSLDDAFIKDVFTKFRNALDQVSRISQPESETDPDPHTDPLAAPLPCADIPEELDEPPELDGPSSVTDEDCDTSPLSTFAVNSLAQSPRTSVDMTLLLPSEIWHMVAAHLPPSSAAALALTSRTMRLYLGTEYWDALNLDDNKQERATFLEHMGKDLPNHVLCYRCAKYHRRRGRDNEVWVQDYQHACPLTKVAGGPQMTKYRIFPTELYQLVMRAHHFGDDFGIPLTALNRRWSSETSESEWRHHARCAIINGHLLVKVQSSHWVEAKMSPSELRIVIAERYGERFAHCKHIGSTLDRFAKCAVRHICAGGLRASDCAECRPLRRCAQCPTEYLVEVKLLEDRNASSPLTRFRHALIVSRWSDLGDGSVKSPEWLAIGSEGGDQPRWITPGWNSVKQRTLRSKYESHFGRRVPEAQALELKEWRLWTKKSFSLLRGPQPEPELEREPEGGDD